MTTSIARGGLTALRIHLRTGYKAPLIWLIALGLTFIFTVVAVVDLYGTNGDYSGYAATLAAVPAMAAINGTPYGAGTLGGVVSNEFGFVAAVVIPIMGLLLVVGRTRKAEESGLMELLLSRSIGRRDPWIAAVSVAFATELALGIVIFSTEWLVGIDPGAAALYSASIAALAAVFSALAVLLGQLLRRGALVTGVGILLLAGAYAARAVGDVRHNGMEWLSPLAWQQETRPFTDDIRVWPLLLLLLTTVALMAAGLYLVNSRDMGAAIVPSRAGSASASALLRTRLGLTLRLHLPLASAWVLGTFATALVFGIFTGDIAEVVEQNPQIASTLGGQGSLEANYVAMMIQLVALMAMAAGALVIVRLREEETGGRLEPTVVSASTRAGWIALSWATVLGVATATQLAGGLGLWLTAHNNAPNILLATTQQLVAVWCVTAIGLAFFAFLPRWTQLLWLPFSYVAVVSMLGATLRLPTWSMKASPSYAIGAVPAVEASDSALWFVGLASVVLVALSAAGFKRRDIGR